MADETLVLNEEQAAQLRELFHSFGKEFTLSEEEMTIEPKMKETEHKRPILIPRKY